MSVRFPWHIWPGQGWPGDAEFERAFVDDLRERAGRGGSRPNRVAVVLVVTALRSGAMPADVLSLAQGADPSRMLAAYERVAAAHEAAWRAWEHLLAADAAEGPLPQPDVAARIAPRPVAELLASAREPRTHDQVRAHVLRRVAEVTNEVDSVAAQLRKRTPMSAAGRNLGRVLFDPDRPCLYNDPYFLPRRVGELAPLRLTDVLQERRDDPNPL